MLHSLDDLEPQLTELAPQRAFERDSGLPWHRTVEELAFDHGVVSWRGVQDVVPIPAMALGLNLPFRHRYSPDRCHYPASDFDAEVNPFGEHRKNHGWLIETLSKRFGRAPRIADVSNCFVAFWEFGVFEVVIHTFLLEHGRSGANRLYDNHPDLWQCSNLTVESRLCAYREPDASLNFGDGFDLRVTEARLGVGEFLTNRLLVPRADVAVGHYRVWRDEDRIGIANRCASIVQRYEGARLQLLEMLPAKGCGSASLQVNKVTILTSAVWDGLSGVAARVAEFYQMPLEVHRCWDD